MVDIERDMHSGSWPHAPIVARRRSSRAGVSLPTAREFYSGLAVLMVCGAIAMTRGGPERSQAQSQRQPQPYPGQSMPIQSIGSPAQEISTANDRQRASSERSDRIRPPLRRAN